MGVKSSNISTSREDRKNTTKDSLPVVFLDGGTLFPQNILINQGLSGLRLEDVGTQDLLDGLNVLVVSRSVEGFFENHIAGDKEKRSHATYGTIAHVSGVTKLTNGQYGLVLKGAWPCKVNKIRSKNGRYVAACTKITVQPAQKTLEMQATLKLLKTMSLELFKTSPLGSQELFTLISSTEDAIILCHLVVGHLTLDLKDKVNLLACDTAEQLISKVTSALVKENEFSEIVLGIQDKVKGEVNSNMRKAFLREQIEAMKTELGELDGSKGEVNDLRDRLENSGVPSKSKTELSRELDRMEMMSPGSSEYMVSYNYINTVLELPWEKKSVKPNSISEANAILDSDHHGLTKVKERILEYVGSLLHVEKQKGQILLLVGPPGVGKTSLAKSVARALNRSYERVALGGLDDVAELRGHRRTYIGAMPGRIIEAVKRAKSSSAVILLDEIDKSGRGLRGDVGAALLEILDPEQNKSFQDNYIALPFDLSDVVFIATANTLNGISAPLLDRMEIISVGGYDEEEKLAIAKKYLVPTLKREFDLRRSDLKLSQSVLRAIIRHYTRESGVRMLNQRLSSLARKSVCKLVADEDALQVSVDNLSEFLGKPLFKADEHISKLNPGVAIGLAYTAHGGEILHVEAVAHESEKGSVKLTGQLGDVMKESASAVMSYILANAELFGLSLQEVEKQNIHIHFPEGAIPKDGPSAGVALLSCLISLFKNKAIVKNLAMTGEITLRGDVLPIGGVREKAMAAHRSGIDRVIIPAANWFDLDDIPAKLRPKMKFYPVSKMIEVLRITGLINDGIDPPIARTFVKKDDKVRIPLRRWQPERINEIIDSM